MKFYLAMSALLLSSAVASAEAEIYPKITAGDVTHVTFTGRFTTKRYYYELTQSFEFPSDSIAPSRVTKGMECVSQSSDGCDEERCMARLYFDIGEKRLGIRSLADDQMLVDLPSSASILVWIEQENCSDPRVEIPTNPIVSGEITDRLVDFQLEGHKIGGWMLFSGHGTLVQNPASNTINLQAFHFDSDRSQSLYVEDYVCLEQPSIFEENCRAHFLNGLTQASPSWAL